MAQATKFTAEWTAYGYNHEEQELVCGLLKFRVKCVPKLASLPPTMEAFTGELI